MNVVFEDKLTATVFHHTLLMPGNEAVGTWLFRFFRGGWCDRDTDFPQDVDPALLYRQQRGKTCELRIGCASRDIFRHPEHPEVLLTKGFSWAIRSRPVDEYGTVIESSRPEYVLVGGLINHGDLANPSWSSHT